MKACFSRKRALKGFSKRARFVGHAHTISIEEAKDKTRENGLQSDCRPILLKAKQRENYLFSVMLAEERKK